MRDPRTRRRNEVWGRNKMTRPVDRGLDRARLHHSARTEGDEINAIINRSGFTKKLGKRQEGEV